MARAMKDSGIEWLGQIPADWNIRRIKNVAQIYGRIGFRGYTTDDLVEKGEGAITLSPSNLFELKLVYDKCSYISWEKYNESPEIQIKNGDILFVKTGSSYGKSSIVSNLPLQATINPQLVVFKNIAIDNKFFLYFLQTPSIKNEIEGIVSGGTIPTMTQEKMKNFHICVPPLDEQRRIATFLDNECARIDSVIEKTRASIAEYKKLKQSIITRAVTKGIRPERLMQDSGIEWLGQIPADWKIHQIKNDFHIFSGATPKSEVVENWDGDIIWLTPADYKTNDRYISQGKRNLSEVGYKSCGTTLVPSGSIVFSKRAPIGTVAITKTELCTNQGCLSCVPKITANSNYYYYVMSAFTEQFNLFGTGTTFKEISYNAFRSFKVPFPPIEEQREIANYLDEKTAAIDLLVSKKNQLVTELESLKKSLIFEYVTGKKEVPT